MTFNVKMKSCKFVWLCGCRHLCLGQIATRCGVCVVPLGLSKWPCTWTGRVSSQVQFTSYSLPLFHVPSLVDTRFIYIDLFNRCFYPKRLPRVYKKSIGQIGALLHIFKPRLNDMRVHWNNQTLLILNWPFTSGETIQIACEFSNSSSRSATPKATLVQNQKYSASDKSVKTECKTLESVTGEPVKSGTLQAYSEIRLTIPDTCLSISNCSIIDVNYNVLVGISVK